MTLTFDLAIKIARQLTLLCSPSIGGCIAHSTMSGDSSLPCPPITRKDHSNVAIAFRCRIIAFSMLIHYFTLWPWPLTLNICTVSPVTLWNSIPNLNASEQSAVELLRFQYSTQWPWTYVTCCARLWDNFTKFEVRQLIRSWIIVFVMLIRYVTLWPWPLTSWPWTFTALRVLRL